MNCQKVNELMEEYIMGELDTGTREAMEGHLKTCEACTKEYEEMKEIILDIKDLKSAMIMKEDILEMSKRNITNKTKKEKRWMGKLVPTAAACFFLATTVLSGTVLAFPTFASQYVPNLPVVKEMAQAKEDKEEVKKTLSQIKDENEEIKSEIKKVLLENENLKIQLKEIEGTEIKEVVTSKGIDEKDNNAIQALVLNFIKAQYKGDIDTIKEMSTKEFKDELSSPQEQERVLKANGGEIVFSTITNVAKEGDTYMVFVRLNDTSREGEAEYQQNFELKKVDDKFLVSFVGMDA